MKKVNIKKHKEDPSCVKCGNKDLSYQESSRGKELEVDEFKIRRRITCFQCGAEMIETYVLSSVKVDVEGSTFS